MQEINNTVDDAKEAIRQIRELAVLTGEALLDLRLNSNTLVLYNGRDEFKDEDKFTSKVFDVLNRMSIPQSQLTSVTSVVRAYVIRFYCGAAYRFGRSASPPRVWGDIDSAYQRRSPQ